MLVHHTVGLRQQMGRAKLHLAAACRHLRKGVEVFSEDIPDACIVPSQMCRHCAASSQGCAPSRAGLRRGA